MSFISLLSCCVPSTGFSRWILQVVCHSLSLIIQLLWRLNHFLSSRAQMQRSLGVTYKDITLCGVSVIWRTILYPSLIVWIHAFRRKCYRCSFVAKGQVHEDLSQFMQILVDDKEKWF